MLKELLHPRKIETLESYSLFHRLKLNIDQNQPTNTSESTAPVKISPQEPAKTGPCPGTGWHAVNIKINPTIKESFIN